MTSRNYRQSLERMQQSIKRLDDQLQRSRQLVSHDITIDNKTKQNLNLIIKIQEEDHISVINKSQSRVVVPHQTTYRHQFSSSARDRDDFGSTEKRNQKQPGNYTQRNIETSNSIEDSYLTDSKHQLQMNTRQNYSSVKVERKFQPFTHMEVKQLQRHPQAPKTEIIKKELTSSSVQTQKDQINKSITTNVNEAVISKNQQNYPSNNHEREQNKYLERIHSEEIGQQGSINDVSAYTSQKQQDLEQSDGEIIQSHALENTDPINIPQLMSQHKHNTDTLPNDSPQGVNYIDQQCSHHPQIYSSYPKTQQDQPLNISFSSIDQSNTHSTKKTSKQLSIQPLHLAYKNNKKYFEQIKEKQRFNKIKLKADQKRMSLNTSKELKSSKEAKNKYISNASSPRIKSKDKEFGYIGRFQYTQPNKKQKANDLFLERKTLLLKNLQKSKQKDSKGHGNCPWHDRSRSKTNSNNLSFTTQKSKQQSKVKQRQQKIKQVSQRLYSRSKQKLKPCDHHQRHAQSIERERFFQVVNKNTFVQKYVTKEEQEDLFQKFRREDDSVSSWPMKILNYTYGKLQKINGNSYTTTKIAN